MVFLQLKNNKWYLTEPGLTLLQNHKNHSVICHSYLFSEGSAKTANSFFFENLETGFEDAFLEHKKGEVIALIDIVNQDKILKISLFASVNLNSEIEQSETDNGKLRSLQETQVLGKVKNFQVMTIPKSIMPGKVDLMKSVVTTRTDRSSQQFGKLLKELYRNLFSLLAFLSNVCVFLVQGKHVEQLIQEFLCDYHMLSRFKPSKESFNLETNFFIVIDEPNTIHDQFQEVKKRLIEGLRGECKFFLSMAGPQVRIKHLGDSWQKYTKEEEALGRQLNLKMRVGPNEEEFVKKVQNLEIQCQMIHKLINSFTETVWNEMDMFNIWQNIVYVVCRERITNVITENQPRGDNQIENLKKDTIDIIIAMGNQVFKKEFLEVKVKR